jgi:AraC-like DNA-binding protein
MITEQRSINVTNLWSTTDREISVHYFQYGPIHSLEHVHGEFSINIPLDHSILYRIDDRIESVEPGSVLVIQPGEWHTGVDLPHGVTISVSVRALKALCGAVRPSPNCADGNVSFPRLIQDRRLRSLGHELAYEMCNTSAGKDIVITSLVTQFLVYLLRGWAVPLNHAIEASRHLHAAEMVRTIEHMNDCPKRSFSLQTLCTTLGTSQSRFVSLFNASTGSSPLVFYNRILIQKAKHLLVQSDLSIKETAFILDFQSESHFCSLFRSIAGSPPSAFRSAGKLDPLYTSKVRR